ncbi:copper resistance protein CopD [Halorubrum hochstenium]|uniref:copper resistance protein CopD n=1 Tax=Halorubrum TaxID=56688 RepID=UPI00373AED8A
MGPSDAGRDVIRTAAYAAHVLSGAFWTGAVLFVVYAVLPRAREGALSRESFADAAHRLLMVTRWTGVALPLTGAYLIWLLYRPLELLTGTSRGWAVLAMLSLWGVMNGLVELGVLRMRREIDPDVGWGTYMAEGFPTEALGGAGNAPEAARLATVARPYLLASAALAVLLLVDAALLAGGLPG